MASTHGMQTAVATLGYGLMLCFLTAWLTGAAAEAQGSSISEPQVERHAIVIGVNRYTHLQDLEYADRDAILLSDALGKLGYTVTQLLNHDADPDDLKARIVQIGELMDAGYGRESGSLLITFSGHGYARDSINYLAMSSARMDGSARGNLPVSELLTTLHSTGIARQFLFIDACRNIPVRSGQSALVPFVEDTTDRGQAVLYSTAGGELSYEDSELEPGHGVFSWFLAQALSGQVDADANGVLRLNSVYEYVRREVSRHVSSRFGEVQVPYRAGESSGDLSLGLTNTVGSHVESDSDIFSQSTSQDRNKGAPQAHMSGTWKILGIVAGVLAVGALVAAGDSDAEPAEAGVTLVIPTP